MSQHSPYPKGESAPCVTDFMPSLRRFRIALFHLLLCNSLSSCSDNGFTGAGNDFDTKYSYLISYLISTLFFVAIANPLAM